MSLLSWLFAPKPYECSCGKRYRDGAAMSKHVWKHALDPNG